MSGKHVRKIIRNWGHGPHGRIHMVVMLNGNVHYFTDRQMKRYKLEK